MTQVVYLTALYALGLWATWPARNRVGTAFLLSSALLWGLCIVAAVGFTCLATGITWSAPSALIGSLALATTFHATLRRRSEQTGNHSILVFAAACSGFAHLATILTLNDYASLSFDSFYQLAFARTLATVGSLNEHLTAYTSLFGTFMPLQHSAGGLFNGNDAYLYALQPAIGASLLGSFVVLVARMIEVGSAPSGSGLKLTTRAVAWLLATLATVLVATSYFVAFQFFYIHNSLPSGAFVFLFVAAAWLRLHSREPLWLGFATAALIAFSLLRTESVLFAVLLAAPIACNPVIPGRERLALAWTLAAASSAWQLVLYGILEGDSGILSPNKLLMLIAATVGFAAFVTAGVLAPGRNGRFAALVGATPSLALAVLGAAVALTFLVEPNHMRTSAITLATNLDESGHWGVVWWVALPAVVLVPWRGPARSLGPALLSFVLLVHSLAFMRDPYRLGWGDSGNRMMTHVLFALVAFITASAGSAWLRPKRSISQDRRKRLPAATPAFAIAALLMLASRLVPPDLAAGASVVSGPTFHDGHGFEVALGDGPAGAYVAPLAPGPATVVLDLGRNARPRTAVITQYAAELEFTDWSLDVAAGDSPPDGADSWTNVFESVDDEIRRDGLNWVVPLRTAPGPARFVRLRFRAAKGQNRMLLRQLSLY